MPRYICCGGWSCYKPVTWNLSQFKPILVKSIVVRSEVRRIDCSTMYEIIHNTSANPPVPSHNSAAESGTCEPLNYQIYPWCNKILATNGRFKHIYTSQLSETIDSWPPWGRVWANGFTFSPLANAIVANMIWLPDLLPAATGPSWPFCKVAAVYLIHKVA